MREIITRLPFNKIDANGRKSIALYDFSIVVLVAAAAALVVVMVIVVRC